MSKSGILLTEVGDNWEIRSLTSQARRETIEGHEPVEVANRTIAFAKVNALDIGQIVIAVASESVLFASLPQEVAAHATNNAALRFALESVLPVDAESIVADAIHYKGRGSTRNLATVCLEVAHLKPIAVALEKVRGRVQFIVPSSLLAMEQALFEKRLSVPCLSIWISDQSAGVRQVEIIVLGADKSLSDWRVSGLDDEILNQHLLLLTSIETPVLLCGTKDEIEAMAKVVRIDTRSVEIDRSELLWKRAKILLTGREVPWVDLRRDDLAMQDPLRRERNSLVRLALAIGLLIATLCGTLLWHAQTYRSLAEQTKQKQQELFRVAFPSQRTPAAILGRLKSEHTKAKGIRRTDPKSASRKSALMTLNRIIASLTEEFPFEVQEIRIEDGRFSMEIELLSQQDAGRIVAALAKEGFDVEPPSTTLINSDRIMASIRATAHGSAFEGENDGRTFQ